MFLDRKARELVVRVAYAGQPLSGKTQSIRALSPLLKGAAMPAEIFSPGESSGRTLYFDWANYNGGSFRGHRIRCQIVTVPGQEALTQRRRRLIESADVVVFVVDSEAERLAEGRSSYREMLPWLERKRRGAVPVVFQCNKRDLPSAVELAKIRAALDVDANTALFETTATDGRGIRATFVAAVRAAVGYAESLDDRTLTGHPPDAHSGEQMLEVIQRLEAGEPEPDRVGLGVLGGEARRAEDAWRVEEARRAEEARKADEALRAEQARRGEESHLAEEARKFEEARKVDETRRADEARKAEEVRKAEEAHKAEEAQRASHQAEFERARQAAIQQRTPAPTKGWTGAGPRPAIMPASEWRRLSAAGTPATAADAASSTPSAASSAAAPVSVSTEPARQRVLRINLDDHRPRPAVMPAASWLAKAKPQLQPQAQPLPHEAPQQAAVSAHATTSTRETPPSVPSAEPTPQAPDPTDAQTVVAPLLSEHAPNAPDNDQADREVVLLPHLRPAAADCWPHEIWKELGARLYNAPREAVWREGAWTGEVAAEWIASSAHLFGDQDTGREALAMEVERRERLKPFVWPYRCLILSEDDAGYWRLWEVLRKAPTLDLILQRVLAKDAQVSTQQSAGKVMTIAQVYLKVFRLFADAPEKLLVTFRTIAPHEGRFVYAGALEAGPQENAPTSQDPLTLLEGELRRYLPKQLEQSVDLPGICRELQKLAQGDAQRHLVELLNRVLTGH